jgi:hypothetical protein
MNKLLKKLLASLFPGIDGEQDDPVPDDPAALDPDGDGDDDLPELDLPDDPPAIARPRHDDAADRLARLEAEVERRGRLAAEAERNRPAPVDATFQREEERLRSADITELERWQIESNRTLRATQQEARQARMEAADMMDRARFEAKVSTDPRRSKYAERVEEAINEERRNGRNASREAVYYYMLGKDIAEGKLKSKPRASSAPAVARGRPAGVRSDVQGRGRPTTDQDKRRARLENQNI